MIDDLDDCNTENNDDISDELNEQNLLISQRRKKLQEIRLEGVNPYANRFPVSHRLGEISEKFSSFSKEELEEEKE